MTYPVYITKRKKSRAEMILNLNILLKDSVDETLSFNVIISIKFLGLLFLLK